MHLKCQNNWPPDVSALDALNDYIWQRHLAEKSCFKCIVYKTNNKYYEILTIYIENRIYIREEFKESLGMNFFSPFQPEREFKLYK